MAKAPEDRKKDDPDLEQSTAGDQSASFAAAETMPQAGFGDFNRYPSQGRGVSSAVEISTSQAVSNPMSPGSNSNGTLLGNGMAGMGRGRFGGGMGRFGAGKAGGGVTGSRFGAGIAPADVPAAEGSQFAGRGAMGGQSGIAEGMRLGHFGSGAGAERAGTGQNPLGSGLPGGLRLGGAFAQGRLGGDAVTGVGPGGRMGSGMSGWRAGLSRFAGAMGHGQIGGGARPEEPAPGATPQGDKQHVSAHGGVAAAFAADNDTVYIDQVRTALADATKTADPREPEGGWVNWRTAPEAGKS